MVIHASPYHITCRIPERSHLSKQSNLTESYFFCKNSHNCEPLRLRLLYFIFTDEVLHLIFTQLQSSEEVINLIFSFVPYSTWFSLVRHQALLGVRGGNMLKVAR